MIEPPRQPAASALEDRLEALDDDQGGAVILMALAGILILLLFSLMIYDIGLATKEKTEIQGATDFAALTQASVKARSMNMMAYGNIAKRSIWATHSMYPAHTRALGNYIYNNLDEYCSYSPGEEGVEPEEPHDGYYEAWRQQDGNVNPVDQARCAEMSQLLRALERDLNPFSYAEGEHTWPANMHSYAGGDQEAPTITPDGSTINTYSDGDFDDTFSVDDAPGSPSGAETGNALYHYYDLKALDNHQRFVAGAAPWWGWTEKLLTGIRNGATVTASIPSPPGLDVDDPAVTGSPNVDRLPVLPPEDFNSPSMQNHIQNRLQGLDFESLHSSGLDSVDDPFVQEHIVNTLISDQRSLQGDDDTTPDLRKLYRCEFEPGCDMQLGYSSSADFEGVIWEEAAHDKFLGTDIGDEGGIGFTADALQAAADTPGVGGDTYVTDPWSIDGTNWSDNSSNIVVGYMDDHRDNRGVESRDRYDFVGDRDDPALQAGLSDQQQRVTESVGYWGMARAEVAFADPTGTIDSYTTDGPDLWHPAWTARLRPVSLPDDQLDGSRMSRHLELNQMTIGNLRNQGVYITDFEGSPADDDHTDDFLRMRWALDAYDDDTSQGIVK